MTFSGTLTGLFAGAVLAILYYLTIGLPLMCQMSTVKPYTFCLMLTFSGALFGFMFDWIRYAWRLICDS